MRWPAMQGRRGLLDENNDQRGLPIELKGGSRWEKGELWLWLGGCWLTMREIEEGKRKRKRRERVVCRFSVTVLYIFPCRSAVLFFLVLLFLSRPSLSLFLSFPWIPRCPVAAHYLSPSLSSRACLCTRDTGMGEAEVEEEETEGWIRCKADYNVQVLRVPSQKKARAE